MWLTVATTFPRSLSSDINRKRRVNCVSLHGERSERPTMVARVWSLMRCVENHGDPEKVPYCRHLCLMAWCPTTAHFRLCLVLSNGLCRKTGLLAKITGSPLSQPALITYCFSLLCAAIELRRKSCPSPLSGAYLNNLRGSSARHPGKFCDRNHKCPLSFALQG